MIEQMRNLKNRLFVLRRDDRGASIVEFALIAPILAMVLFTLVSGATFLAEFNAMHTAVNGGAQYVMNGGTSLPAAKAITESGWGGRSGAATVAAAEVCKCGTTVTACASTCSPNTIPLNKYIKITATDTFVVGPTTKSLSAINEIRVQ